MQDTILFPTDGSAGQASAIKQYFTQARQYDVIVHGLYPIDIWAYVMLTEETQGKVKQVLLYGGERTLQALTDYNESEGIELVSAIQEGIPHEVIPQYADEYDISLIFMGTHGRSGDMHRIVGSVAEAGVRNATIPVMTVLEAFKEPFLRIAGRRSQPSSNGTFPDSCQRRFVVGFAGSG